MEIHTTISVQKKYEYQFLLVIHQSAYVEFVKWLEDDDGRVIKNDNIFACVKHYKGSYGNFWKFANEFRDMIDSNNGVEF